MSKVEDAQENEKKNENRKTKNQNRKKVKKKRKTLKNVTKHIEMKKPYLYSSTKIRSPANLLYFCKSSSIYVKKIVARAPYILHIINGRIVKQME